LIALSDVPDDVFSAGMMGDGVAIEPSDGHVVSPIDGTIQAVFPTKHAIGIIGNNNEEILIHMGLDTVSLQGQGFETLVEAGQSVKAGEPITNMDLNIIKQAGYATVIPILVTNSADFASVTDISAQDVQIGDTIITIKS
jgi:glucose-specific phosphotransferase system IIA component